MRLALLLALAPALAACYETPQPSCAFSCGPSDDCPSGYSCRADSWCKRDDVADGFDCGAEASDAPASDGGSGTTSDASPDAAPPDAAPADAAPADADPPDASDSDAGGEDAMNSAPQSGT
jgi:hypothetical protein